MPIIKPEEYTALKAAGLITLVRLPDGRIQVTINRGEKDQYQKAAILAWLAGERLVHTDAITILDIIKADIDPL
jgi:hypothetical protein